MKWFKEHLGLLIILFVTLIYLFIVMIITDLNDYTSLKLNEKGDLLAGIFSPLAFLWLVYGYLQQGQELKQNTKALTLQGDELRTSNESFKKQCEELEKSVKQQAALLQTAKEELQITIAQHEQINRQQLIQAQPYFHISEMEIKVTKLSQRLDINISFKIMNSRTVCRGLFFLIRFAEHDQPIVPTSSTSFDLFEGNTTNSSRAYIHTTVSGKINEIFDSSIFLQLCYTDAYDEIQLKIFRIDLIQEDTITFRYHSHVSISQIFF